MGKAAKRRLWRSKHAAFEEAPRLVRRCSNRSFAPLCPEGVWGTVAHTVTALRFSALTGRQSCRFLEIGTLNPPLAALVPISPMFLVGV